MKSLSEKNNMIDRNRTSRFNYSIWSIMTPPRPSPWRGGGCSTKSDMLYSDNRDSMYYKWFETKTLKINVLRLPPLQGEGRGGVIIDQ